MKTAMRREIDTKVETLLTKAKSTTLPVDLEKVAAFLKTPLRYEVLPKDISGFLHRDGGNAIIVINKRHPKHRQRFTIAHEVGHLVFDHKSDQIHVDKHYQVGIIRDGKAPSVSVKFRKETPHDIQHQHDPEETQANAFAAALLMPRKMLEADVDDVLKHGVFDDSWLTALTAKYEVSMQALLIQLNTLNVTLTLSP